MNNFLIETELGYTNHVNGKYVTEDNATHIAVRRDDQWIVEVYEREELPLWIPQENTSQAIAQHRMRNQ